MDFNYPLTRYLYRPVSVPVAHALAATRVTPSQMTWLRAVVALAAGAAFWAGRYWWGAALTLIATITDCVDGDLARLTHRTSRAGALLDSVLDRWADSALILGLGMSDPARYAAAAAFALSGALLTSYTRARAQSLGVDCPDGVATRDIRMILLIVLPPLGYVLPALVLVAALGWLTSLLRMRWAMRALDMIERPASRRAD